MDTPSLYALFYMDRNLHKSEYEKRFQNPETIHLDFTIDKHPAFFLPTMDFYKKAFSIERADNQINQLCNMLPPLAIHQFALRCLIDEIVLTNNIEGVHSTRKEITEILTDLSENTKARRFYGLVNKYTMLISNDEIPINSCQDIRKIYDDLFLDEIEAENKPDGMIFRKDRVSVYSPTGKEIHYGLAPESAIIDAMEKALTILRDEKIELLFRVSVFHYLFGYIHPFYDGNGRTSRFISSYILSKQYNHIISYRIAYTIKENIGKYYEAFKICNHPNNMGDLTLFVDMFLTIVDISMTNLRKSLEGRVQRLEHYRLMISRLPGGSDPKIVPLYDLFIQAALFSDYGISASECCDTAGISKNTFFSRIKHIPDQLMIRRNQGRSVFYSLNLQAVDESY